MDSFFGAIFVVLAIAVVLVVYFLPTIIAGVQAKRNVGAIFALNLLLGWSLIGWAVSLTWALTHDTVPVLH